MDSAQRDPLAVSLAAGDQRAYAVLYDRYAVRLYRAAVGMLGRREDAEDAVQEVFAAVFQSSRNLAEVQNLTAYLFTALRRAAGRRATARVREPRTGETALDEITARADPNDRLGFDTEQLQKALLALPAEQREVIALKIDGQLTFAEIAQVLGISANTAASRYRYALERLRAALQQRCADATNRPTAATGSKPPGALGKRD